MLSFNSISKFSTSESQSAKFTSNTSAFAGLLSPLQCGQRVYPRRQLLNLLVSQSVQLLLNGPLLGVAVPALAGLEMPGQSGRLWLCLRFMRRFAERLWFPLSASGPANRLRQWRTRGRLLIAFRRRFGIVPRRILRTDSCLRAVWGVGTDLGYFKHTDYNYKYILFTAPRPRRKLYVNFIIYINIFTMYISFLVSNFMFISLLVIIFIKWINLTLFKIL